MNNLECRKQGFGKYVCKHTNKEIKLSECTNCPYKKYKNAQWNVKTNSKNEKIHNKIRNTVQKSLQNSAKSGKKVAKIKQKSSKLAKMERERESLFTDDLDHCIICGRSNVNLHEIFFGKNRLLSIKYKLVIPLCNQEHHNQYECKGIHFDKKLKEEWQIKGQIKFEETYPNLSFRDIFGKNYLDK